MFEANLQYFNGVVVDDHYPCHDDPRICENDYCRCRVIDGAHWSGKPDFPALANYLHREFFRTCNWVPNNDPEITRYVLERILAKEYENNGLYLEVESMGDYYGEEVRSIWIARERSLRDQYQEHLFNGTALDKIKKALLMEYESVSPSITDQHTNAEIMSIPFDKVVPMNANHLRKINADYDDDYSERVAFGVVVFRPDGSYLLIDGHHRVKNYPYQYENATIPMVVIS